MSEVQKNVTFNFRIGPSNFAIEGTTPPDRARLDALLPLFRSIVDATVEHSIEESRRTGERISCCKGALRAVERSQSRLLL